MSYFNSDGAFASTSSAGTVIVTATSGLSIDVNGNISNADRGSSQNIFKTFSVQGDGFTVAKTNSDQLTFAPGGRMLMNINSATNIVTVTDNGHSHKKFRCLNFLGFYSEVDVDATVPEDTFTFVEGGNGGIRLTTSATDKTITITHFGILNVAASGYGISAVNSTGTATITLLSTSTNTAGYIVARDGSGDFSAGSITGTTINDASGNVRSVPVTNVTTSTILSANNNGEVVSITTGTITVPANTFPSPYGQIVSIYNSSTLIKQILAEAGVTLRLAGTASTGTRTLSQYGVATVMAVSSNTFVISGAGLA